MSATVFRLPPALLLALSLLPVPPALAGTPASTPVLGATPQVAAHRGGAMHRPENTLPAFRHAVALGAHYLELDMVMTADDALVVYHDDTLNPGICRTRTGADVTKVPIRSLSLQQLQALDCGSTVRAIYDVAGFQSAPGAHMPMLDDLLAEFAQADVQFFAETKVPATTAGVRDVDPLAFARKVDAAVRTHGLEKRFILQSKDPRTLQAMATVNPAIRTCLYGPAIAQSADIAATLRAVGATCTLIPTHVATADTVARLRAAGVLVFSEVVDDDAGWQRYHRHGADVLITNHPEGAMGYVRAHTSSP